jgi:glycogen(starch) synthase
MRVLFWSGSFWPSIGGVQIFAAKLLPALQARGYEFVVVTQQHLPHLPKEARFAGIPVYRFPFYMKALEGNIDRIDQLTVVRQQVAKLKRSFVPDLVHVNSFTKSVLFHLDTLSAHPAPFLVTLHTSHQAQLSQDIGRDTVLRQALRSAAWVTCVSAASLAHTRQWVPEITSRSSVTYNGLEEPPLLPDPLPINPPRLLCLGRLAPEKGFDLALSAFASIVDRFPQARLVIAGDGPSRTDLEQQTIQLGLTKVIEFVGWVAPNKVPALINTATMVVLPSRWEALPLVALEAAFMARPVVATQVGGLPEVVVHQETGLLVNKEDSVGLAEALLFLLEHPEVARQMGQAARRRVQEFFSFEQCVNGYDALYQKLIREGRSAGTT